MINKLYLNEKVIFEMKSYLKDKGFIVLNDFFEEKEYLNLKKKYSGLSGDRKKIPDKYSYEFLEDFNDSEIIKFVQNMTGEKKLKLSARRFGHRDYTLIHDEEKKTDGIDFFIFLCDDWQKEWGGMRVYTDYDGDSEPLLFVPSGNAFCLVDRKKGWSSFVKYVNNLAGKNKFVVLEGSSR